MCLRRRHQLFKDWWTKFFTGYRSNIALFIRTRTKSSCTPLPLNNILSVSLCFKLLRIANLKRQQDHWDFLRKELTYLGYLMTQDGSKAMSCKCRMYPQFSQNLRELERFLGLASYFRRLISNFSKISKPLTNLVRKDTPFIFQKNETTNYFKYHPYVTHFQWNFPTYNWRLCRC